MKLKIAVEKLPKGAKNYYLVRPDGALWRIGTPAQTLNRLHIQNPRLAGVYYDTQCEDAVGCASSCEMLPQLNFWAAAMYEALNAYEAQGRDSDFARRWRRFVASDPVVDDKGVTRVAIFRINDGASGLTNWAIVEWPPR